MKKDKVRYYNDYSDDFEISKNQDYKLKDDYIWVKSDFLSKLLSAVIYSLAIFFSCFYCRLVLRLKVVKRADLSKIKNGCFLFGNHTQPVGDVFIPALCVLPKRIYTIVSTANYGIPIIGKILPFLGALPIPDNYSGMKKLNLAIEKRLEQNHPIVIYPEAHVWEYYTEIRPFPNTSFSFPVSFDKPSYTFTVTYQKTTLRKRPKMIVYLDGPFFADGSTKKEKTNDLYNKINNQLRVRSELSDCSYIKYEKREKKQ